MATEREAIDPFVYKAIPPFPSPSFDNIFLMSEGGFVRMGIYLWDLSVFNCSGREHAVYSFWRPVLIFNFYSCTACTGLHKGREMSGPPRVSWSLVIYAHGPGR